MADRSKKEAASVATSATTREATVRAGRKNVAYHAPKLGGARYVVKPHHPKKRKG